VQKRVAQMNAVSLEIEATEAKIRQVRQQLASPIGVTPQVVAAGHTDEVRKTIAGMSPELEEMKDKFAKALKVARKLNAWFVEHSEKMNIQDPSSTPSAFLERLLETCETRAEALSTVAERVASSRGAASLHPGVHSVPHGQSGVQPLGNGAAGLLSAVTPAAVAPMATAAPVPAGIPAQAVARSASNRHGPPMHPEQLAPHAAPWVPGACPAPAPWGPQPGGTGVEGMWVRDPDAVASKT